MFKSIFKSENFAIVVTLDGSSVTDVVIHTHDPEPYCQNTDHNHSCKENHDCYYSTNRCEWINGKNCEVSTANVGINKFRWYDGLSLEEITEKVVKFYSKI